MFLSLDFKGPGPGYSSIDQGAFTEHGPFQPTRKGGLVLNRYNWYRGKLDPISIACLINFAYTKN
jgi:hypothetical protein